MKSLTDDEIWKMTPKQMKEYAERHPEEAWRFAKVLGESAIKQLKKTLKNSKSNGGKKQ